ncbi:MAG: hypothetical protein K9M75_11630 [Phycisphaerae bacterium]|nr:hypothetical protein [Phycisphaerae bacterium]
MKNRTTAASRLSNASAFAVLTKMQSEKGKKRRGVAATTTPNNIHQNELYQDCVPRSSGKLKQKAVELLLLLQNPLLHEIEIFYWSQFKTRLYQFYDIQGKQNR